MLKVVTTEKFYELDARLSLTVARPAFPSRLLIILFGQLFGSPTFIGGCRVAQLVECLVTSGYPDGSSSGGPGSNPCENENFWKIPRITRDATTLA